MQFDALIVQCNKRKKKKKIRIISTGHAYIGKCYGPEIVIFISEKQKLALSDNQRN